MENELSPDLDLFMVKWIKSKREGFALSVDQALITEAFEKELEKSNEKERL